MIRRMSALILIFLILSGFHWWDPFARWIGLGNSSYEEGDFEAAEDAFSKAEKVVPGDARASHNLGASAYRQDRLEDAEARFRKAAEAEDPVLGSNAWYDLGCTQLKAGNPEEAVKSFVEALKSDPRDSDAKINLEYARKMMEQMQNQTPPPQQQDGDNQESDENQKQTPQPTPQESTPSPDECTSNENNQSGTPTPTQTPEGGAQQESQPESGDNSSPPPEPVQAGQMSPEEAQRLLDALEEEEMEVLKRFHQLPRPDDRKIDKDW